MSTLRLYLISYLPVCQFPRNIFPGYPLIRHQYHHVVQEVGNLILHFLRIRIFSRNHNLCRFLAQLLQDLIDSLVKQIIGIGTLLRILLAVENNGENVFKYL